MKRSLTDTACRNAKPTPEGKPQKHTDGGGLYLLVSATAKYWRYDYRFNTKRKTLAIGVYPDISLKDARCLHEDARQLLAKDIDPSTHKQVEKITHAARAGDSFETVALEWYGRFSVNWSETHKDRILSRFKDDVFPWIGKRSIGEITPPELLVLLRRIESRGATYTAHKVKQFCGQVFRYAVATGRAIRDPTPDLKGALPPTKSKNFATIIDPPQVGELMRAIYGYSGDFVTCCALRLLPLVFVRPGNLRAAEWSEFDLVAGVWEIPAGKMKGRRIHRVPLSRQAVTILQDLYPLTGRWRYVFPSIRNPRDRCMSENTINASLRRMGYTSDDMTGHGFRSMASTLLHELGFDSRVIEVQLAHQDSNEVRGIYNRSEYWKERTALVQRWADYLDTLREGAQVIPFKTAAKQA
ncbi:MAG: integrase [Thiothrix lacustris]|uniref:Integrase n=1 Tax=Thiothrix lacustris TaxID=525917 RepID=A0A1Y1QFN4_9GAMM|nr:MAG: integrase [Thiothrix lacustris]